MDKTDEVIKWANDMRIENQTLKSALEAARNENEKLRGNNKELKQRNLYITEELGDAYAEICRLKERNKDLEQVKKDPLKLELKERRRNPALVFPAEVWEMIIENLEDPKDLKNVYDVSSLFQSILQKKRNCFLITDVLRILSARGDLGNLSQATRELMKCRTVNKNWKKSIDNLFQDEAFPPIFPTSTEYGFNHPKLLFEYSNNHWLNERIRTMSADMNPMISRFLEYHESSFRNVGKKEKQRYREDFIEFLLKFGHHVWYFKVQIGDWGEKISTSWFALLKTWLTLLPNLKSLHIDQPMYSWWKEDLNWTDDEHYESTGPESTSDAFGSSNRSQGRSEINNLKFQLQSEWFPTIESLRTLVLEDCLPQLATSVLKNNPQIERLKVKRCWSNSRITCSKPVKLNALQELSLDVWEGDCSEIKAIKCPLRKFTAFARRSEWNDLARTLQKCFGETLQELTMQSLKSWRPFTYPDLDSVTSHHQYEKTTKSPWKSLKKLNITYTAGNSLEEFFQSLSIQFGTVVTELTLIICNATIDDTALPRLNMPSLKILNLELNRIYTSMDLVLPLVNLETLNVEVKLTPLCQEEEELNDESETIKFHQFIRNVRESNIWQLLPKLKIVKIRNDRVLSQRGFEVKGMSSMQFVSRRQLEGR